ncbi:MAG: hypothetical protein COW55_14695 [Rhodobacteraceae bacterium CG17_big_fil_post_rev_8_21_14_2_50_65_11]|nr:MAG: hypothetical protein COW55_14695 [Rhodobacteraceae bacterium CG17_big_fil_post_rev_8_21_14_2_50_65_11]
MRAAAVLLIASLSACSMAELRPADPVSTGLTPDVAGLQPAGTDLRIDFGRAQAGVIETVSRLLGSDPADIGTIEECGAGPVTAAYWTDGLTVNFLNGDFVGWALSEPGLVAAGGLAVGDTPPPVPMTETTLGREFEIGGVWALLAEDSAEITTVWSGITCFFR